VKFFFDNCISVNLAEAMKLLNRPHHEIQHLCERFPEGTDDVDWLTAIAPEPNLVIVSADPTITTAKKEKEVWRRTGLTSFFFGAGFADKGRWVQTLEVVRWWPVVVQAARDTPRGTGYLMPFKGRELRALYAPFTSPS
jgi:hypothetical protein